MARLATERQARDQAAADLRQLQTLVAVMALVKGGNAGRTYHAAFEQMLQERASTGLEAAPPEPEPEPVARRRKKK